MVKGHHWKWHFIRISIWFLKKYINKHAAHRRSIPEICDSQTFRAALWTMVSLCIWWQLFSTRSSNFSKFVAHELRTLLLSFAVWKQTIPIGRSILATSALDTTISDRCFSASWKECDQNYKYKRLEKNCIFQISPAMASQNCQIRQITFIKSSNIILYLFMSKYTKQKRNHVSTLRFS